MGETAIAWRCSPSRFTFSTAPTPFSQRAEPSPFVVQAVPGNPHWDAVWHGFPKSAAVTGRAAPRQGVPASPGASWRRTGRGGSGGSDPHVLTASAAPGRVSRFTSQFTVNPPLGVAPSIVIPRGKAIEYCRGQGRSTHRSTHPRRCRFFAPSRPRSWEREKGAAGVMEGPGERSPRSGVRRAGAPRQPQCITLGRLAPRHYALRRRPRCPRLARPSSAAPACGPRLPPAR